MKPTLDDASLASNLPVWLRKWARECKHQTNTAHPLNSRQQEVLWRILSDVALVESIVKLAHYSDDQNRNNESIKDLLEWACRIHLQAETLCVMKPSDMKKKLERARNLADKLASELSELSGFMGRALDLDYLLARLSSDAPIDFSQRKRGGLKEALRLPDDERVELSDLLLTLRDDIREEATRFPARINQLDGGDDAPVRYQIRALKKFFRNRFGQDNDQLIARLILASQANSTECKEESLISRIRKTHI